MAISPIMKRSIIFLNKKNNLNNTSLLLRRRFSSNNNSSNPQQQAPIEIPGHLLTFTLMLIPVGLFTLYADRFGRTEESLEEELQELYEVETRKAVSKNKQFAEFFQHTVKNPNADRQRVLQDVFYGGKEDKTRLHEVDEKRFGKTQSEIEQAEQQEAEQEERERQRRQQEEEEQALLQKEEQEKQTEKKKRKKRKKLKVKTPNSSTEVESKDEATTTAGETLTQTAETFPVNTTNAVTMAAIVSVAGLAGYLFGGRRNS